MCQINKSRFSYIIGGTDINNIYTKDFENGYRLKDFLKLNVYHDY